MAFMKPPPHRRPSSAQKPWTEDQAKDQPLFSVVIPVFNSQHTIEATVRSVLAQTERDFELLLVDDGSTDASLQHMRAAQRGDDRIRIVRGANQGVSATRNRGVSRTRGRLIAFLDADDLWDPCKLQRHAEVHAQDPLLDVSFAGVAFMAPEATGLEMSSTHSTVPAGTLSVADLLAENPVCTASNLVATRACLEAIGGFRADMRFAEDQEWLARAAACGRSIRGLDEILVGYRTSPDGLSSRLDQMLAGWRAFASSHGDRVDLRRAEAVYCRHLARRALRGGHGPFEALHYALRGMALSTDAFFNDPRRGGLTLASAALRPILPRPLRARLFA